MSTYREVLRLQTSLLNESSVIKRRAAGMCLLNLVSDPDTVRRLGNEARPKVFRRRVSLAVARRHALSVMWQGIVRTAVAFMDRIMLSKSKSKFSQADVQFFRGILLACDKADIGFEDAYSSRKLTKKEAKEVVKLCLELLEDAQALEVAELQVLELTAWVCSRAEYVTHFRPTTIQMLVELVEKRLLQEDTSSVTTSASLRETTATLLENLVRTASEQTITLDSILSMGVKLLSTLCSSAMTHETSSSARGMSGESSLFNGITILLRYSPEQSIGPLSRHGRTILSYAKSRYPLVGGDLQRHSLHQYFLAHVYVSQVAGKLQGLVPGDLGDLGRATLSYRQISALLELIMKEALKVDMADRRDHQLEPVRKTLLELAARLFACAQRFYFTQVELQCLKTLSDDGSDASVDVEALMERRGRFSEQYWELPSLQALPSRSQRDWKMLAQSPFGVYILQPLYESCVAHSEVSDFFQHPMFKEMGRNVQSLERRLPDKSVQLLALLSTASEIFPSGNCWSGWSLSGWKRLVADCGRGAGQIQFHLCSTDELSAVVELTVGILCASGTPNGDQRLQRWSLLCLRSLAEATKMQSFFHRHEPSGLQSLEAPWRAAWSALFRSDLRYRAYTKTASADSIGSLVLSLLASLVDTGCTDPGLKWTPITQGRHDSFMYCRQDDIWNLPLFANPDTALSSSCFELMYCLLFRVGLSDGQDSISVSIDDDGVSRNLGSPRRKLLLDFCIRAFESQPIDSKAKAEVLNYCILCLIYGAPRFDSSDAFTGCTENATRYRFCYTAGSAKCSSSTLLSCLREVQYLPIRVLWKDPTSSEYVKEVGAVSEDYIRQDVPTAIHSTINLVIGTDQASLVGVDSVSSSSASTLSSYAIARFKELLASPSFDDTEDVVEFERHSSPAKLCIGLKILVSLVITKCNRDTPEALDDATKPLVEMINVANGLLSNSFDDKPFGVSVLTDLCQIARSLIENSALKNTPPPVALSEAMRSLLPFLHNILNPFDHPSDSHELHQHQLNVRSNDFMEEDDDSDSSVQKRGTSLTLPDFSANELVGTRGKRKAPESTLNPTKRMVMRSEVVEPSRRLVAAAATLMITLEPSYQNITQVSHSLLGVDELSDLDALDSGVDILGGINAFQLLSTEAVFFFPVSQRSGRKSSRISSIVLLAGQIVKAVCDNTTDPFLVSFRFQAGARLVELAGRSLQSTEMSDEEAGLILELIGGGFEGRLVRDMGIRHVLRASQLKAATDSFARGNVGFHSVMDKEFPRRFVLPSLTDLDGVVRRQAAKAVAAALSVLPQDRVSSSVLKRLPRIANSKEMIEGTKKGYAALTSEAPGYPMWDDATLSIEHGVLECWGSIISATSSDDDKLRVIYDFVMLALNRPDLELVCYQSLDRAAVQLGYECAQVLLENVQGDLVRSWIERSDQSLIDLPLLVSAPSILGRVMLSGLTSTHFHAFDARATCSQHFVARHLGDITITVLCNVSRSLISQSVTREGRRRLYDDRYMREVCGVVSDCYNDGIVREVLSKFIPQLVATQEALLCGDEGDQLLASELRALSQAVLSEDRVKQKMKRRGSTVIRRFLDATTRLPFSEISFAERLLSLGGSLRDQELKESDPFTLDLLMYSRFLIAKACVPTEARRASVSIQVLCEVLSSELDSQAGLCDLSRIGLCLQIISSMIGGNAFTAVQRIAIRTLKSVVGKAVNMAAKRGASYLQLRFVFAELLGSCMSAHEFWQRKLVGLCVEKFSETEYNRVRSLGFIRLFADETVRDSLGWGSRTAYPAALTTRALAEYRSHVDEEVLDCLIGTFEILQLVKDGARPIGLEHDHFVGAHPPYSTPLSIQEMLFETNPSFCAQHLFPVKADESPLPSIMSPLFDTCRSLPSFPAFSNSDRLCRAEVSAVSMYLRTHRRNAIDRMNSASLEAFVRGLASLCGPQNSEELRSTASYCLGELWPMTQGGERLTWFPKTTEADPMAAIDSERGFEQFLLARVVKTLSRSVQTSSPQAALIAFETIQALRSYSDFAACMDLIDDQRIRTFLTSLGSCGRQTRTKELWLSPEEESRLRERASNLCGSALVEVEWCWQDQLWSATAEEISSFDSWICSIVPGILVTHYSQATAAELHQFVHCQRICVIDPTVSASLFPALLFDLLHKSLSNVEQPASPANTNQAECFAVGDNVFNEKISKCFTTMFRSYESRIRTSQAKTDLRRLELALDTITDLQLYAMQRFVAVTRKTKGRSNYKSLKSSTSSQESAPDNVAKVKSGAPYGVLLHLKGLHVVDACIQVGRFASAMFFAELYADARWGRSTNALHVLKLLSTHNTAISASSNNDISGLNSADEYLENIDKITIHEAGQFLDCLGLCCDNLGDPDTARCFRKANTELGVAVEAYAAPGTASRDGESSVLYASTIKRPARESESSASLGLYAASCLSSLDLQRCVQPLISGLCLQQDTTRSFSAFEKQELREKWFECLLYRWRWDDTLFSHSFNAPGLGEAAGFHELAVESLVAFARDDFDLCLSRVREARQLLIYDVALLSNPESSTQSCLDCLDRLSALNDLHCVASSSCPAEEILNVYCSNAKVSSAIAAIQDSVVHERKMFGQTLCEIVMRSEMLKLVRAAREHDSSAIRQELVANLWRVASYSHVDGRYSTALSALHRVCDLNQEDSSDDFMSLMRVRLQEAVVFERMGDVSSALRRSGNLIMLLKARASEGIDRDVLLGEAMVLSGKWMGKNKLEPAQTVLNSYLKPAAELAMAVFEKKKDTISSSRATHCLLELAQLSSSLFETVSERVESTEWRRAKKILAEREIELQNCKTIIDELRRQLKGQKKNSKQFDDTAKKLRDNVIYATQLERQVENARRERQKVESSIEGYRKLTLRSIVSALSIADSSSSFDYSRHIYRMVSLWFSAADNPGAGFDEIVRATMQEATETVPTFRFVPMASQLFSRLGQTSKLGSTPILHELIFKMCLDHPYHCLTHLLCLANGMVVGEGVGGRGRSDFLDNSRRSKVEVACEIMHRLRGTDTVACDLVDCYQTLTNAYIHLALSRVDEFPRGEKLSFSKIGKSAAQRLDQCISKRKGSPLCILTSPPPIRPRCDYLDAHGDLIGSERLVGFEKYFSVATGGISKPKIVTCLGSNGSVVKELVKGHDEIRQDAVMEQVFGYVNDLLVQRPPRAPESRHPRTSDRNEEYRVSRSLNRMVTYAIVPLSPASGIVEWVEDTLPFAHCVVETRSGAGKGTSLHSRYFPHEWTNLRCTRRMQSAAEVATAASDAPNGKRAAYDEVCRNYTPCFRYFFVERFSHSMQGWYTAKQQFAKSVAASSIVGHVLGIGDRHGSNILVHERTGEVVHIDFGIVFEQGKLLTVPEAVPFRLTPNILDGLGPAGTDGLFTKASESVLSVLRENASALLTILSAVVSDPLYLWSMSPVKARERQRSLEEEAAADDEDHAEPHTRDGDRGGDEASETTDGPPSSKGSRSGSADAWAGSGDVFGGAGGTDRNEAAAQAIGKVQEKLQGYEDGTSGEPQSVEGQVRWLLHTARDADLLCEMYHGWQAWV